MGADPIPGTGLPDSDTPLSAGSAGPLPRLTAHADFARGGRWDACPPSASLGAALETASGLDGRCRGASRDELLGMLRQCQAMEAWSAATKFGVLRALIRDDDEPLPGGGYRGDLPEGWTKSLTHEVALAVSMPALTAEKQLCVAWDLEVRLP